MSSRVHRRLRLPADDRSPAVARAAVRQVLVDGGRCEQLDEALLLVSELSTNGVVHAGTPVDVDVLADETGVTITVSDQRSGLVGVVAVPEPVWDDRVDLAERGRGLVLVDRLASSWGTSHHATGKSVWFRLGCVPSTDETSWALTARDNASGATLDGERRLLASELRAALSPRALPIAPGVEFGAVRVPAGSGDVGGDFYDVLAVRRNRWFVSLGTVSGTGTGTQAAVVAGVVRDVLRALVAGDCPTARALTSLNRTLLADSRSGYAAVAAVMVTRLEPPGRVRVLEVALRLAGHDRPVLVRADGTTDSIGEGGCAVGLVERFEAPEVTVRLCPGDSLVFVTAGPRERWYDPARLRDLLPGLADRSAQEIADRIREDALSCATAPADDDIAAVVVRNPAGAPPAE